MSKEAPLFRVGPYWGDYVPGSKYVYIFWYEPGTREVRRRSSKTTDAKDAEVIAASWLVEKGPSEARQPDEVMLLPVLKTYYEEHSDSRPNPSAARRAGDLLLDFLGDAAKVSELSKSKQREFIKHLHEAHGYSVAYISRIQSILAAALKRATKDDEDDEGMLVRAPRLIVDGKAIADLLDAPEPEPDNWHPTFEMVAAFLDAVEPGEESRVLRYALLILLFAGRPEAVLESRTCQLDRRHEMMAWNPEGRRQTKKFRPTVPVPSVILPHMVAWAGEADTFIHSAGAPVVNIRPSWDRTEVLSGVHLTPKSLRHFMATEMRRRKVPKEERDEYMGHRRRSTGDHYGVFDPDWLSGPREVAEALISELQSLCKKDIFRQVAAKSEKGRQRNSGGKFVRYHPKWVVGGTGIEPVTPTMSTSRKGPKVA